MSAEERRVDALLRRARTTFWEADAACQGQYTDDFYPEWGRGASAIKKTLCARCPVMDLCRAAAFGRSEYGIWGGMTEWERQNVHEQGPAATRACLIQGVEQTAALVAMEQARELESSAA